jgi:DNA polymerase-3 subunit chi
MILFYHLTRSTAEETAAQLLARAAERGMRVMVRGTVTEALERLDQRLWLHPEGSFLPHGLAGGEHDAAQPILIAPGIPAAVATVNVNVNGAVALMLLDNAEASSVEARGLERVWILFDGADPVALNHARGQWTRFTADGIAAQYWSEESGRWEKKAGKNDG